MPERRQLAVTAFHPRGRQVKQGHPALAQVPGRQGGLDVILPGGQPVHRVIDLIGGRPGHSQVGAEGDVVPPADRGQLGGGPGYPGDDQRDGQVPFPARRAQQPGEPELGRHHRHRGHMPVAQRPGHLHATVRVDHGLPASTSAPPQSRPQAGATGSPGSPCGPSRRPGRNGAAGAAGRPAPSRPSRPGGYVMSPHAWHQLALSCGYSPTIGLAHSTILVSTSRCVAGLFLLIRC